VDFTNLFVVLSGGGPFKTLEEAKKAGAATLNYGLFINNIVNFFIIAFAIFVAIKVLMRLRLHKEAEAPGPSAQETLLTEIRDILKEKKTVD
jgi:large conductance mechanosensitive channel